MTKSIIKELIIILLLCLAIILILGVLLYEYVPTNKLIPEKVSYVTPENVKEELNKQDDVNESQVVLTYEIDSTDLNNYQKVNKYKPGKTNPFSSYETEQDSGKNTINTNNSTSGGSSTTGNNQTANTNNTSNAQNGYFQDKGTK